MIKDKGGDVPRIHIFLTKKDLKVLEKLGGGLRPEKTALFILKALKFLDIKPGCKIKNEKDLIDKIKKCIRGKKGKKRQNNKEIDK